MRLQTPVEPNNEPETSYIFLKTYGIAPLQQTGMCIVLESTKNPSATDTDIVNRLNEFSLNIGVDNFFALSPKLEDPCNVPFTTQAVAKQMGRVFSFWTSAEVTLYERRGFLKPVEMSSTRVAECTMLLENTYRSDNIALVN